MNRHPLEGLMKNIRQSVPVVARACGWRTCASSSMEAIIDIGSFCELPRFATSVYFYPIRLSRQEASDRTRSAPRCYHQPTTEPNCRIVPHMYHLHYCSVSLSSRSRWLTHRTRNGPDSEIVLRRRVTFRHRDSGLNGLLAYSQCRGELV